MHFFHLSYLSKQIAWVDKPSTSSSYHTYAECSAKGICDRTSGQCQCFEGFAGNACQRMSCPSDCSGHGTCEYIEELSTNDALSATLSKLVVDSLWDNHKSMACVCDPGYIGIDCTRRMCPKANDIMDERLGDYVTYKDQVQNITLYGAGPYGNGTESKLGDFFGRTFALKFKSTLNETFSTVPIMVTNMNSTTKSEAALSETVATALMALPNKVITHVDVSVRFGFDHWAASASVAFLNINVKFNGASTMGPQNLLQVLAAPCNIGCTPQITGFSLHSVMSSVKEKTASDYSSYECGRRGKCSYDTGICSCFSGFTGQACTVMTALV